VPRAVARYTLVRSQVRKPPHYVFLRSEFPASLAVLADARSLGTARSWRINAGASM